MADVTIGTWVRRRGKWHLVESVVAEDAITRCGRRMDRWTATGGELQVSAVMPLTRAIGQPQLCKQGCDREDATVADVVAAFPPEDDAATSPVDPVTDTP